MRKSTGFVATMIRTRFDGKLMSRPPRNGHDPYRRYAFLQTDRDRTNDNLKTSNVFNWRRGGNGVDNHCCESTTSSGAGKTSLLCRAIVHHDDRWFGFSP